MKTAVANTVEKPQDRTFKGNKTCNGNIFL